MNILTMLMSYRPTLWGIFRIAAWACLFLYLFAIVLPEPQPTRTDPISTGRPDVVPMKWEEGDLKWTREKPDLPGKRAMIAWVADSSAKVIGVDPLTGSTVVQALPTQIMNLLDKDDNKLDMLFYYTKARREAETYALLLEAIAQNPDAIVMTLNPFWVYNRYAFAQADSLFGTALNHRGLNLDHLVFSTFLVNPRDTAFGLVGNHFRLFRDNLGYHRLFVHDTSSSAARTSKPNELIDVYFKYPLDFWLDMGGSWHGDRVRKLMTVSNPEKAYWNRYFLRLELERLTESGIPTYIYLAPVSPELMTSQEDADNYLVVMDALQRFFANSPPNIRFDLKIPPEIVASIKFGDLYHYKDSGMLPDFLASKIQDTLDLKNEKIPH